MTLASASQANLKQTMVYTVDGSGAVTVDATVDATGTSLGRYIRIGTVMELPEGYENVEWYGNGPVEAMWDREDFATVGRYSNTVSGMFYPYLDTQDTGTVTGVKWISVTNPSAKSAMAIAATDTVEASALHFTVDDLDQAQHPYELTKLDSTILTVTIVHREPETRAAVRIHFPHTCFQITKLILMSTPWYHIPQMTAIRWM